MQKRGSGLFLVFFSIWLSSKAGFAQSPAYAKFDSRNATIGLYHLLPDTTGCERSRLFSGKVKTVSREVSNSIYTYSFTLSSNPKLQIHFIIAADEIPQKDVDDLVAKNRRLQVRARACGSGGIWTAEEIKRL
jgi:hypothetical protein